MTKRLLSGLTAVLLLLSLGALSACGQTDTTADSPAGTETTTPTVQSGTETAAAGEVSISLADGGVTVDGAAAPTDSGAAVYVANDIIYYEDGTDSTYGEGSAEEMHSAAEADSHTVVHITAAGTYRLSGSLSAGQIFVDLGEAAASDPSAVVTLILDGADITCTVAPAVLFYRVYECCDAGEDTGGVVDTAAAGANVMLADGSVNTVTGSHVARIYKEGTTKKLHKYDAAFYSKMSMNLDGDSGQLYITADNEGLDSELHLTINGGVISIQSQDDGINTNEDGISVTTINGGTLTVDAGLGSEGDGIDSNGYLTINGGTVYSYANGTSGDGGIDADSPIAIQGGTVAAFGSRNDAADSASAQPYMELSFASTLPAGSVVELRDAEGNTVFSATAKKVFQSLTLSSADLALDTVYSVYVDGVQQQYTGNSSGMGAMGGGMGGGRPNDGTRPGLPDDTTERPTDLTPPEDSEGATPPERAEGSDGTTPPELPEGTAGNTAAGLPTGSGGGTGAASTEFTLTASVKSFSGVSASTADSGKTQVSFTVEGLDSVASGEVPQLTAITTSEPLDEAEVQITVTDDPSESYSASCLLSDGLDAVNALLPTDDGDYILTVAVVYDSASYTGVSQIRFSIGG